MTVILMRVESDRRCHGCGKVRWVDRKTCLCLYCMGQALDSQDRHRSQDWGFIAGLKERFAAVGREIKSKLVEFNR